MLGKPPISELHSKPLGDIFLKKNPRNCIPGIFLSRNVDEGNNQNRGEILYLRVLIIHSNTLEISQVLNSKGLVRGIIAYHFGKCYTVIKNAVYRWVYGIRT